MLSHRKLHRWLLVAALIVVGLGGMLLWTGLIRPAAQNAQTSGQRTDTAMPASHGSVHSHIMTTVFWVGETASSDNADISNTMSAWDETWQADFGGVDDPDHRSGYAPAAFTPRENAFYFALPYSDFTEGGTRKSTANDCLPYDVGTDDHYSWCKNDWIAITYHNKTVYAQWEDVGPGQDDDTAYVFGSAVPRNTFGARAGLDVSPAVRDYLGLDGENLTSWPLLPATAVPNGPWKTQVTTDPGARLD